MNSAVLNAIKPIAIHLPQFHPIPENDEWWGKGFTEWTNVTKAKPLFKGHYQPHLPADLGFYDLRLEEARIAQAEMARTHGIHGFCYYHYWFNGQRLLERPVDEILKSGKPDFPFMLCWANETWSRRWLGEEKEILVKQDYSAADDVKHAEYLAEVFQDERYINIDGRPLFIVYRPYHPDDVPGMIGRIKQVVHQRIGKEPFILANNSHGLPENETVYKDGYDGIFNFRPLLSALPYAFRDEPVLKRLVKNTIKFRLPSSRYKIYSHQDSYRYMQDYEPESFKDIFPCVHVSWDNSARRGMNGIVTIDEGPQVFKAELERVKNKMLTSGSPNNILFINAWNEWAEGNHLEPCRKWGTKFLEAVKDVFYA